MRAACSKAWRKAHPIRKKRLEREWNHQAHYGEPYSEKEKRIKRQKGRCANPGCRTKKPGPKGWQTDHDHETGQVRGELCGACNKSLGFLHDDPVKAEGLAVYVRRYK